MNLELGHFALILALFLAVAQSVIGIICAAGFNARFLNPLRMLTLLQFILLSVAFGSLISAFALDDFSLKIAFEHSHSLQPMLYKITSVWGNHEGSMLMWVLILAGFSAAVAVFGTYLPARLWTLVLTVQSVLAAAFGAFVIFTSNPFERIIPAALEGQSLNPVLQDVGLAIHPPLLYLGYVGLSVCYAFAVAALISGRIDAAWARWVRPWALAAWVFLTLGLAMGSYWAYYELGWGGWWFWDPVENAAFMPWLVATALLHSALVMERREALKVWTVFLAILAFSLSLLGTFLVRSGVLTSVHTFAADPARGVVILGLLMGFVGGAVALYAWRAPKLKVGGLFTPISREGALVLNNLFLSTATLAVLVGTLYPLVLEAVTGDRISVGAPFFNSTFGPLMVPLFLIIPLGPFLAWKRGDLLAVAQRLMWVALAAGVALILALAFLKGGPVMAPFGIMLAVWMILGAIAEPLARLRIGKIPFAQSINRLKGLQRGVWSTALAHMGIGLCVLGIVSTSAFESENIALLKPYETAEIAGYTVTFEGAFRVSGPNYVADQARFIIAKSNRVVGATSSERRIYTAQNRPTTEAGISTFGMSQLYIAVGEPEESGAWVVRIWHKPLILLIWIGALVMAGGGILSLTDRRLRVGAPTPSKGRKLKAAP